MRWYIFNVADMSITFGVVYYLFLLYKDKYYSYGKGNFIIKIIKMLDLTFSYLIISKIFQEIKIKNLIIGSKIKVNGSIVKPSFISF